jgi:REP element-mobilizing transposase RayT
MCTDVHLEQSVEKCARKYGVKIYEWSNVGNHIHLLIKIPRRQAWAGFIRELTGEIASLMKQLLGTDGKFWMFRPHTRIVQSWHKAYQVAKTYVQLNELEAQGLTNRIEIGRLKQLREIMSSA